MAELGHHFRNVHLQNLVDQNEELRRRIAKLTEIQGYVELLVDKLQKAQVKEKSILNQNTILRQQIRQMELKFANSQNMHGDQMRYVFSQHDQLVEEKNMAIIQLKNAVQKQSSRAAQIQTQARFQKANQQKMVAQYEEGLIKYRNRVGQLEQDLQILYKSLQDQKFHHNQTKDNWISQSSQLKQTIQEKDIQLSRLKDQNANLTAVRQKLQRETDVLVDFNQNLESKLALTQKQTTDTIMALRNTIDQLQNELMKKQGQIQSLKLNNASLMKQIDELKIVQANLRNDNQTFVTDNQRLIFLLQQSDKENIHLRQKHRQLEDYSSAQIEQLKLDNLRLRQENNVLNKNNAERQTFLGTKLIELKEASAAKDSLKVYFDQSQGQIVTLRGQLEEVQIQLLNQKKFSTEVQMERKKLAESTNLLKQQNLNLDQMLKKFQKQNLQLSSENHNLSKILNNPRQQNKDYVQQMDKIIKNFHLEREDQNKRHNSEKQKLKDMYEYEFRQKQMLLTRQIASLQQQLGKSAKLEVLVQKQRNKLTPNRTQYRTPNKI